MNNSAKSQQPVKGALIQCLLIVLSFMPVLCLNLIDDTESPSTVIEMEKANTDVSIEIVRP